MTEKMTHNKLLVALPTILAALERNDCYIKSAIDPNHIEKGDAFRRINNHVQQEYNGCKLSLSCDSRYGLHLTITYKDHSELTLKVEDYGRTWALTEEELESGNPRSTDFSDAADILEHCKVYDIKTGNHLDNKMEELHEYKEFFNHMRYFIDRSSKEGRR